MRLRALVLLVPLALATPGHGETVYRCPGPDGGTVYRDSACDEGEAIELPLLNEGEGLRPGERELLRELRAPEPQPPESAEPPAPPGPGCPGVRILDSRPYRSDSVELRRLDARDGLLYRQGIVRQCARLELELTHYYGRLRDSVAEDLTRRLYAEFADGSRLQGQTGELTESPRRLGVRETVRGRFCFGGAEQLPPLARIACE